MAVKRNLNLPDPPPHLREATRLWWSDMVAKYEMQTHHLKLLTAAGEAWDRGEQARELIAKQGIITQDRFGQDKMHPACIVERDSRGLFARLLRELGCDVAEEAPRPPQLKHNK